MSLPKSAAVTGKVELSGGWVEVRGLSIAEVRRLYALEGGPQETDPEWIAAATGNTVEEAREWISGALAGDVKRLLGAIWDCSGLGDEARFQGGTRDDAGVPEATQPGGR